MQNPRRDRHAPSPKEICQKVETALAALEAGDYQIIADRHNQVAMDFLGAVDMEEVLDWAAVFLQEIKQIGPVACFVGKYADRCSHTGFTDIFLFPYHWDSPSLGERVYLKFGIKTVQTADGKTHTYYHLDCHEDQP